MFDERLNRFECQGAILVDMFSPKHCSTFLTVCGRTLFAFPVVYVLVFNYLVLISSTLMIHNCAQVDTVDAPRDSGGKYTVAWMTGYG